MHRVMLIFVGTVKNGWRVLGSDGHLVRKALCIALINGLVLVVLLLPLFQGYIVKHTDANLFSYPMITLFGDRISHGGVIWNDLSGAGFPSLYVHGYLFQPLLWILLALTGPITALHYAMFLYAWLGSSMVAFALLRMGYRPAAAWLGGIAFPFVLWSWLFEPTISFFLPLFGAACLAVSVMDTRPTAAALCSGILVALAFLSLQSHYAVLLLIAVCLLWLARRASIAPKRGIFARANIIFGLAVLAGLFVGALRVLPLVAYAILSTRKGEFLDTYLNAYSIGPGYFFRYVFSSTPLPVPESFFANTPFLGVGIVMLALLGVFIGRRRLLVYVAIGICAVTLSLAVPSSVTFQILRLLPGVAQLGDPTRYLILGQLALIALAVEGLHVVVTTPWRRIIRFYSFGLIAALSFLFVIGLTIALVPALSALGGEASRWPPGKLLSLLSLRNFETDLLVFGGLLIGILLYATHSERIRRWYVDLVIAFVAAFLLLYGYLGMYRPDSMFFPVDFVPPTISILSDADAVIFPFLTYSGLQKTPLHTENPEIKYLASQALGIPNTHLLHGLRNITMFDHIQPKRLDTLLAAIGSENIHTTLQTTEPVLPVEQLLRRWHILERLGVSHVLTSLPLPGRSEAMNSLLFPEILATSDTGALVTIHESVSLYVYEVPNTRRHLSAPKAVVTLRPDEEVARNKILNDVTSERAVIECIDCPVTDENGQVQFTLLERTPQRTHVRVQTTTQRWVVIHRQLLPGWRVRVDGKQTRAAIADSLFIAVPVPAGDHNVVAFFSLAAMFEDTMMLLLSPKRTPWFS